MADIGKDIETSAEKSTEKLNKSGKDKLKTALSMEINRSMRADLSFTLMKIYLPQNLEQEEMRSVKDNITGKIRSIDQIYFLAENIYAFLLPLTDLEGSEVFLDKMKTIVEDNTSLEKESVEREFIIFPQDVVEEDNASPQKQSEYREKMIENIDLE
ncbi:hypothetical protein SAMN04488692_104165 [Halarsenatibacter silvermanii]|uniref:GGDEF domain-containing protein n=1 Tax=Halarsenatibacter silvermanii TaxID=321763 RepID=A0A1G9K434_9FIRM|nr:hypothetical protein SAMN04488692_104165 [Halarsenatibacter silvermanii]